MRTTKRFPKFFCLIVIVMIIGATVAGRAGIDNQGLTNFPAAANGPRVGNGLIVFVGNGPDGQPQIFTIRPDGSGGRPLTQTANGNFYPAWSYDGKQIVWTSGRTGAPEIWVMKPDGSNQTQLTFPPDSGNFVPSWSPEGDQIVFSSVRTGHPEIWVMNAHGSDQQQLTKTATPGGSNAPNWSPDGSQIAFASDRSGRTQVYTMNPDGSDVRRLTQPVAPDFPDSNVPVWSPDGKRIAFWSGIEAHYGQVWVMDADGSNRKPLTDCPAPTNCDNPAWSPDGTLILFETNRRGPVETWIMEADGSQQRPLFPFPYGAGRRPWQTTVSPCREIVPDAEVRCPYHPLDPKRHNVVFVDTRDDSIRAADLSHPEVAPSDLVFDPFLADLGWAGMATAVAPDLERALVMRIKPGCPPYTGGPPHAGLDCSYGRVTLWLAYHEVNDPSRDDDDEWVHINLARYGLGRNSEVHGWSTWLHRDLALFNALVYPDQGGWAVRQEENTPQIYALRLRAHRDFTVEPFAPDRLVRPDCLTGRVNAQPPRAPDRCFAGQRVSFVRRCYSEPVRPEAWAWWNTRFADGTGERCRSDQPSALVPVLRTYVMELDGNCRPTRSFAEMVPAHEPNPGPLYRMMGIIPEWGDMLSAISPDGRYLAMATNMGDPQSDPGDNCGGFRLTLRDPSDPLSGTANRNTHVCELNASLRCTGEPVRLATDRMPPESTPLPGFVYLRRDGGIMRTVIFTREWGVLGQPRLSDVMRVDFEVAPDARVPLAFGRQALAILPIYYVAPSESKGSRP